MSWINYFRKFNNIGVSEIIGTILMLGLAISLFSIVSFFILSFPFNTPSPQVDIVSYLDGSDIILEHHGGPSLNLNTTLAITINGSTDRCTINDYIDDDLNSNSEWDIGERIIYPAGDITGLQVDVMVIDLDSNSLLMMGNLQVGTSGGGSTTTPPSLITFVDTIIPYEQNSSPLFITATGDSDLDSIDLYYRWSENNWTYSWTTLTYDDFETGFGHYTDGGVDCELYTESTYAYQGNNAANIQDDTGDASSFYHSTGINVDTSGYTSIRVDFWFETNGFHEGRDWWVLYFDGTTWQNVASYVHGTDFDNNIFYHTYVWINKTDYTFPTDMKIKFQCDAQNNNDDVYIDKIYVNATNESSNSIDWIHFSQDTTSPWIWSFNYPNDAGHYEFYSVGKYGTDAEATPEKADSICLYMP